MDPVYLSIPISLRSLEEHVLDQKVIETATLVVAGMVAALHRRLRKYFPVNTTIVCDEIDEFGFLVPVADVPVYLAENLDGIPRHPQPVGTLSTEGRLFICLPYRETYVLFGKPPGSVRILDGWAGNPICAKLLRGRQGHETHFVVCRSEELEVDHGDNDLSPIG